MDYLKINKDAWNKRTPIHIKSDFYNLEKWLNGSTSLNKIELNLLKDVAGKTVLHLQCHFGQDTLSIARMGATCTGLDFSEQAIKKAKILNKQLSLNATFICTDVYQTSKYIEQQYDIVYTSYGTIGWLPDLNKWAQEISRALKPNGKLIFVEFHPLIWMMNEDLSKIKYNYFNADAIVEESTGTYTNKNASIDYTEISWNHGLAEVFNALKNNGILIQDFQEYNYSPYNCFKDLTEVKPGQFQFTKYQNMLPMVYSFVGVKS